MARLFAEGLSVIPQARLMAVGSRKEETADAFAQRYKIKFAYGSYEELVRNPEVDVVYIATPNSQHKEHVLLCLNAGKPVLCEKPFALNAIEAKTVIDLSRSKHIFCMEAMSMRFLPIVREMRELVNKGAIGEPLMMTADFSMPVAFDPQKNVFNINMGGGSLLDRGVYGLSLAVFLFGKPSRVTGKLVLGNSGVDEMAAVSLEYPDGRGALISSSLRAFFSNEAVITGSTGRLKICEPFFRSYKTGTMRFPLPVDRCCSSGFLSAIKEQLWFKKLYTQLTQRYTVRSFHGNGYNYEAREVMECLSQGKLESEMMPLDDTLTVMEIMDSVRRQNNFRFPHE